MHGFKSLFILALFIEVLQIKFLQLKNKNILVSMWKQIQNKSNKIYSIIIVKSVHVFLLLAAHKLIIFFKQNSFKSLVGTDYYFKI